MLEKSVDAADAEAEAAREEQEQREVALEEAETQLEEANMKLEGARAQLEEAAQLRMTQHRESESWLVNIRDDDWDTNLSTGDETFLVDQ